MKKDFLDYYSDNLAFIRKLGVEFSKEFPKIANRLDLNALECQDPFIERLLEGTAFLSARVEKKLDDGYDRLLSALILAICPDILSPIPSTTVGYVSKLTGRNGVVSVDSDLAFTKNLSSAATAITYKSAISTYLVPLLINDVELSTRSTNLNAITKGKSSCLSIDLVSDNSEKLSNCMGDFLDLYLDISNQDASELSNALFSKLDKVYFESNEKFYELKKLELEFSLIDSSDNLFTYTQNSLSGISLLSSFLSYPDFFKFVRIKNLSKALQGFEVNKGRLHFVFKKDVAVNLSTSLEKDHIKVNALPLINLFYKRTNRNFIKNQYEVNVVVDSTQALDYEISSIRKLEFFDNNNQQVFSAYPFFTVRSNSQTREEYRNFFELVFRPRQQGLNSKSRNLYHKSEAFISVSGMDFKEHMADELTFSANCLCTNADLPLLLKRNDNLEFLLGDSSNTCKIISAITAPHKSLFDSKGSDDLQKLSYVLSHLSSFLESGSQNILNKLKELIGSFSTRKDEEIHHLVDSLLEVKLEEKVFRYISKGCVYFEKGKQVRLKFNPKDLEGVGFFVFSRVIGTLLVKCAPVNLPIVVEVENSLNGEVYTCKSSDA